MDFGMFMEFENRQGQSQAEASPFMSAPPRRRRMKRHVSVSHIIFPARPI